MSYNTFNDSDISDDSKIEISSNISNFYQKIINDIKKKKKVHILSAQYYEKKSDFITIPTIIITSLTGIGSFLSSSDLFSSDQKLYMSVTVGILGCVASLLQSFQKNLKFDTKSDMFRNAAEQYENLLTKIEFEKTHPNEKDFFNNLEKKILEIQNNCKYFTPEFIKNKI
mgnify:FL=1|tara:strand:+ start:631 stop:1140 length:510 start_codon:yes stop_codon:yes gene_type:complete